LATLFAFSRRDGGSFVLGTAEQEGKDDQERMKDECAHYGRDGTRLATV
jgi:hypothetical protein